MHFVITDGVGMLDCARSFKCNESDILLEIRAVVRRYVSEYVATTNTGAMATRGFAFRNILIDSVCFATVGLVDLVLYLVCKPYRRGFFCDDESIRHPYPESITVTDVTLIVGSFGLPIIIMTVTELATCGLATLSRGTLLGRTLPQWVMRCYHNTGVFVFGSGLSQITVDLAKHLVGRLRPHFIAVCRPDKLTTCLSTPNTHEYITEYTCTGGNPATIEEARLSFPSGHAALSFYAAAFIVIYLQNTVTWNGSRLLRPTVQFICVMCAWLTSLSRISDYMHHWSDVLGGSIIGTITAVLVVYFMSNVRGRRCKMENSGDLVGLVSNQAVIYNSADKEADRVV